MVNQKLRDYIKAHGFRTQWVADQLGITRAGLNYKFSGRSEFRASELAKLKMALRMSDEEVNDIFFSPEVEETSTEEVKNET